VTQRHLLRQKKKLSLVS